jgi:transposase
MHPLLLKEFIHKLLHTLHEAKSGRVPWQPEDEEMFKDYVEAGISWNKIAHDFKITIATAQRAAALRGLKNPYTPAGGRPKKAHTKAPARKIPKKASKEKIDDDDNNIEKFRHIAEIWNFFNSAEQTFAYIHEYEPTFDFTHPKQLHAYMRELSKLRETNSKIASRVPELHFASSAKKNAKWYTPSGKRVYSYFRLRDVIVPKLDFVNVWNKSKSTIIAFTQLLGTIEDKEERIRAARKLSAYTSEIRIKNPDIVINIKQKQKRIPLDVIKNALRHSTSIAKAAEKLGISHSALKQRIVTLRAQGEEVMTPADVVRTRQEKENTRKKEREQATQERTAEQRALMDAIAMKWNFSHDWKALKLALKRDDNRLRALGVLLRSAGYDIQRFDEEGPIGTQPVQSPAPAVTAAAAPPSETSQASQTSQASFEGDVEENEDWEDEFEDHALSLIDDEVWGIEPGLNIADILAKDWGISHQEVLQQLAKIQKKYKIKHIPETT